MRPLDFITTVRDDIQNNTAISNTAGVRKKVREAKRGDRVRSVTQCDTDMVVLIHGSIYGNPVADQRTHREEGWYNGFDLLFHMDQESILELECDLAATSCLWHCAEICMYVCHTALHV
jgi:hypothetical protein